MDVTEDFQRMLERQAEVGEVMYGGDPEPWMGLWSEQDPVSLFGAFGPCKTGRAELDRTFRWVGSRFSNGQDARFEVLVAEVCGEMAYSVGYETAQLSIDGSDPQPWKLRVTHVYRREDGEWRLVHRHGDIAPPDQSPTGPV
jgi:ketosteroid isomerase-like protein